MPRSNIARRLAPTLFLPLLLITSAAIAAPPDPGHVVTHILDVFKTYRLSAGMLEAAKTLFWTLAVISLVWTMGMLIVRQDIGEMLMEIVRFMVVTGIFYWLLINVSESGWGDGFVYQIVNTFIQLPADAVDDVMVRKNANDLMARGFTVFFNVVNDTSEGDISDRIAGIAIATTVLVLLSCLAAQFLLMMVTAWVLAYAGIFLLGFGGARWTSAIAISYYKHVIAVGAAILVLSIIGSVGSRVLGDLDQASGRFGQVKSLAEYTYLGMVLAVSVLTLVLGIRVPQLIYTLVTASPLGLIAGSAAAAGSAFATGGAAMAAALQRGPDSHGGGSGGAESVMAAAARGAAAGDAYPISAGTDPFGVQRGADPLRHGSAFGKGIASASPLVDGAVDAGTSPSRRAGKASVDGDAVQPSRPNYEAEIESLEAKRERSSTGSESTHAISMEGPRVAVSGGVRADVAAAPVPMAGGIDDVNGVAQPPLGTASHAQGVAGVSAMHDGSEAVEPSDKSEPRRRRRKKLSDAMSASATDTPSETQAVAVSPMDTIADDLTNPAEPDNESTP